MREKGGNDEDGEDGDQEMGGVPVEGSGFVALGPAVYDDDDDEEEEEEEEEDKWRGVVAFRPATQRDEFRAR